MLYGRGGLVRAGMGAALNGEATAVAELQQKPWAVIKNGGRRSSRARACAGAAEREVDDESCAWGLEISDVMKRYELIKH